MTIRFFLIIIAITSICSCKRTDNSILGEEKVKLTVIKLDNQNLGFEYITDTLMKKETIDIAKNSIDIFFCHNNFQIPYYIPTNGIYRDSIKDKECNWNIYPSTVRCYEYDGKGRVIKMQVEGSGTAGDHHTFVYDNSNKIIEMESHGDMYSMFYNDDGNLTGITIKNSLFQKTLTFIYDKNSK